MSDGCARKILDLSQVTLVDLEVLRFLTSCEDEGIELVQCPPYVRERIIRERVQGSAALTFGWRLTQSRGNRNPTAY